MLWERPPLFRKWRKLYICIAKNASENVRIERIVSLGHTSPESGWYNQEENEWVIVLEGSGTILFENGIERVLNKGDYLNIPAHTKHKVTRTDPNIGFHPLHSYYAISVYFLLFFFSRTKTIKILSVGLLFHMFTDYQDCLWMRFIA